MNRKCLAERLLETSVSFDSDLPRHNLTWEDLADCFVKAGLAVLEVISAPVFMRQVNERVLRKFEVDQDKRKRLLQIELAHCTNRSLVNFAGHLQMVGQKPESKRAR